ncbi:MAG: class I poly(R)-hydroxyalkanoic acid synthase [Proteobacteria bacterium]|nr:class I poly(R)-hydroxyalkanoic acid synthase [Pseudomonadota bacterium]
MKNIADAFMNFSKTMIEDPEQLVQLQLDLYTSYLNLWANTAEKIMGTETTNIINPEKGDRRFANPQWDENVMFNYIKQSYLLTADWAAKSIDSNDHIDDFTKQKLSFYAKQFVDAISPTNFALTNPDVIEETIRTNGENLIEGLKNLVHDIEKSPSGQLRPSMVNHDAFEVGKNVATTEGSVVFENKMFQLIQYTPKTKEVAKRPLLICPPWINKFYILDLQPKNSFIKYSVEKAGQTTFVISWKNPDSSYRDVNWEDYMEDGILKAVEVVLDITGEKDLNAIGYCIAGTLLTSTLAYMKNKNDKRINSATYFTSLADFTEAGQLSLFLEEESIEGIEEKMEEHGYLDGSEMAGIFSALRANDLIWSFVVNNYLMGKQPFPFDLLYWNDDPTRMPAAMHSYYLRNMYLKNNLVKKDKLVLKGEKIDISKIDTPMYYITAKEDHIAPWKGCFKHLHMLKSDVKFVLASSGHIAGVVNPPLKKKGGFSIGTVNGEKNCEKWLKSAKFHEGSWWDDWNVWINKQSGNEKAPARKIGTKAKYKAIEAAPGRYVTEA